MAWALAFALPPASAETSSTAPTAPAKSAEERAQAQADRVFTWIKFQNEAPAKKPAAATASSSPPAAKPATKAVAVASAPPKPASLTAKSPERDTRDQETTALAKAPAAASAAALSVAAVDAMSAPITAPAPVLAPASAPVQTLAAVATATAAAPEEEAPQLRLIHRVEPEFPARMARDFSGGSVVLRFVVQADGSVQQAEAVRATHAKLATAAINAVSQWRFAPISRPREGRVEIGFRPEE